MIAEKRWEIMKQSTELVEHISTTHKINPLLSRILINRNLIEDEEITMFLNPHIERLHDPFLLKDMNQAVDRIISAINEQQQITIYGDYDVDGITSTALLYLFLCEVGGCVNYYIPDRIEEGYGINIEALQQLKREESQVIISVDTGIVAFEQAIQAKALGIDLIITDHHEPGDGVPDAFAVINPKRRDCHYPFKQLAGVGVTFKLAQAIGKRLNQESKIWPYLHLVAVGTIADIVPLINENRIMTKLAFETLGGTWNIGLQALMDVAGVKKEAIKSSDIGFKIGPRLNAAGRLGDAKRGVSLFVTKDYDEAKAIATELDQENRRRQDLERTILLEAFNIIETKAMNQQDKILVVDGEGWTHGVIGIVASRIMNTYHKPTIVLSVEEDIASGSARSVEGFNLFEALSSCKDLLTKFGGHEMAAGMSLKSDLVSALRKALNEYATLHLPDELLIPKITIDMSMDLKDITVPFVELVGALEPYGAGNEEPIFVVEGRVAEVRRIGKEQNHLKLSIMEDTTLLNGVGFSMADDFDYIKDIATIRLSGTVALNEWQNKITPQMLVKDIKYGLTIEEEVVDSVKLFKALLGDVIDFNEAPKEALLAPNKEVFKALYRYLVQLESKHIKQIPILQLKHCIDTEVALIQLLICLGVFRELGLLNFQFEYLTLAFQLIIKDRGKKVELEQSKLYNKINMNERGE